MALDTTVVVSGAYTATWNSLAIGNVGLGGYKLRYSYLQREINFDAVGLTPVDQIFTGLVMMLDFVCMQYNYAAIATMSWPWSVSGMATKGTVKPAGFSMWDAAQPFVMTACCGSMANPSAITFHKTILAPNYEIVQDHSGVQEKMTPIRLIVFPVAFNTTVSPVHSPVQRPAGCAGTTYYTETLATASPIACP